MRNMRKAATLILILALVAALFAGCQGGGDAGASIMVCFSSDPEYMDPARSASTDGATMIQNAFSGLYGYTGMDEAGNMIISPDCAEAMVTPTPLDGGKQQYVFTLREGLKWSDGVDMKASDFTYAWNRAVDPATGSDYQYIFDVIDGYDAVDPALNISADDAARTVTVVTKALCPYFDQLMAFPTYYPVRQDLVEAGSDPLTWSTSPETYISNGAFQMTEWTVGSSIVFEKNANYWDAANVKLDKLTFALSDDTDAIFANYENGAYQFLRNPPVAQIPILTETRLGQDFYIGDYIGTYFLEFNVDKSLKPGQTSAGDDWDGWTNEQNSQVRRALSLLIDRNYIVENVTQAGEKPAYGFVPADMDDGTGTEFRAKAEPWWSVDPADYEANCAEAVEILKQWYTFDEASGTFTDFPTFEYSVNPTSSNLALCAAVQDMWADYGITTAVDQRQWAVIQTALTEGDFTMSRMGWIADYNDPITYLEIYVKASGNNHPQIGKDGPIGSGANFGPSYKQTWAEVYEPLITEIKAESDLAARAELMYQAETILRDSYCVLPIYNYTEPYLLDPGVEGMLHTPLGMTIFKYASYTPS